MKLINQIYKLGETAKENWKLLDDSNDFDVFFHLASYPSGYVILEYRDGLPTQKEIIEGANLCKVHTKYRNLKNLKVDFCFCSNVAKGDTVGQAVFISNRKVKQVTI